MKNKTPASENKLAALLQIGVGGNAKHSAMRANDQAYSVVKNLGATQGAGAKDGKDFIMVGYTAKTELGVFLEQTTNTPFKYPGVGEFACVRSLMFYLQTSYLAEDGTAVFDNHWRRVHGVQCRNKRKNDNSQIRHIDDIRLVVADATWQKIMQYQDMTLAMANSDSGMLFINNDGEDYRYDWYLHALEEMRACLKDRMSLAVRIEELTHSIDKLKASIQPPSPESAQQEAQEAPVENAENAEGEQAVQGDSQQSEQTVQEVEQGSIAQTGNSEEDVLQEIEELEQIKNELFNQLQSSVPDFSLLDTINRPVPENRRNQRRR